MRRYWLQILYALGIRQRPPMPSLGDMIVATLRAHPERLAAKMTQNNAILRQLQQNPSAFDDWREGFEKSRAYDK